MKVTKKDIIETIGVLAVVVSLIVLALEVQQNNLVSEATALQELGIATAEVINISTNNPDLLVTLFELCEAEPPNMDQVVSNKELMAATQFLASNLRICETAYLQVELGLLEDTALSYFGWGSI